MRITPSSPHLINNQILFSANEKRSKNSKDANQTQNKSIKLPNIFNVPSNIVLTQQVNSFKKDFTPEAEIIYDNAVKLAKHYKSPTVDGKYVWLSTLMQLDDFLTDINDGKIKYTPDGRQKFAQFIMQRITLDQSLSLNEAKTRNKIQKVVKKHIKNLKKDFKEESNNNKLFYSNPIPSKKFIKDLDEISSYMFSQTNNTNIYDSYFYLLAVNSQDKKLRDYSENFMVDIEKATMINKPETKKKNHLSFYDEKANSIWESINLGNDTIILCDSENESSVKYLMSSFSNLIKKPGQHYKNINPNNVEIINLNKYASFEFLNDIVPEILKENEKTGKLTVITGNLTQIMIASMAASDGNQLAIKADEIEVIKNTNSEDKKNQNLRFVFTMEPGTYYQNSKKEMSLSPILNEYVVQMLPAITSDEARTYLTNKNGVEYIEKEIGKKINAETIKKAISLTTEDNGYPDNVLNLLSKVSKYFINSDEITTEQVSEYIIQQQKLSETKSDNDDIDIVYDTNKRLDDIVGSQMTKETAESIVKEIKNGTKTKGYLIYQSNYSCDGGGRRNTAEAIAGEAHIPMITINAKEFLMKDMVSLYQNPNYAELKIKTLITKVKAQAKTNPNKTAMVFIENFDNFATDPYKGYSVDSYEQKAFSQLLTEMQKSRQEGVNLIVMGSVNNRAVIDDNIKKPGKFMDEIVIYPPQDINERKDIINYYKNKMNLDIKGNKQEQEDIINHIARTSEGFNVVQIMHLLETAESVSSERGKTQIDKADFTEAFLRTLYGRTNKSITSDHRKQIVTSHEVGHALTLQIMYNILERQNKPWCLPNKVNFITLDPRGYYGGAMYPMESNNEEYSFEKIMSDLICDYGGHSSEKALYGYTGSWGISADMEMARYTAESAIVDMGMGVKTGVRHIKRGVFGALDVSEKTKQQIENDEELLLSTAEKISDAIVENYKDFIQDFTQKYWQKVGTGECIISSEEFNKELQEWKEKQTPERLSELEFLEGRILNILEDAKYGAETK